MRSLQQIRTKVNSGDGWSRINPESIAAPTNQPDVPLTPWEEVWYSLWTPSLYWWISGISPSSTKLGAVERFFWFFGLGLPPRGLLGFWQFTLYVAIIVGVPAAVIIAFVGVLVPALAVLGAVLFLSWALILYWVYFAGQK
jgi:hypothetical protein